MNAIERDQCFGRRLARNGAARLVITRESARVPTLEERVMHWRWRANQPGFGRNVIPDCPQPDSPWRQVVQAVTVPKPTAQADCAASVTTPLDPDATPSSAGNYCEVRDGYVTQLVVDGIDLMQQPKPF